MLAPSTQLEIVFQSESPALLKKTTATMQEEDRPLAETRELKKSEERETGTPIREVRMCGMSL